jgi:hypothetical protein
MKFDLDPRRRSNRPEIIDIHYDRLHNPENCFHFEVSWMNATPKLVEDTVSSWSTLVDKYGLKLVELPLAEASTIAENQFFRRSHIIKLSVQPPEPPPLSTAPPATSFSVQPTLDRLFYQKAILKKFDFVLDFEANSAFPADVEVVYPWGKGEYRYPQYVRKSFASSPTSVTLILASILLWNSSFC